jgi:hypothetical protein
LLALAGIRLHPALRALIGAAVLGLAVAVHLGAGVVLLGAALLVWGAGALVLSDRRGDLEEPRR